MKLIIDDRGDRSVGIFGEEFAIECPFSKDDHIREEDLKFFKEQIMSAYAEFAQGKLTALYDFELEAKERYFL